MTREMVGLLLVALLAATVFFLATSGLLIGPARPRRGPEAWVVDDRTARPPRTGS